ncbi:GerAB/ArcD/ProY family transporter [Oceanirhabdus sp. W0125-5]|uniref:GerAB/ArcD/ProY family transporter n=1 Tax=Oceanirhabdus sp. W0125-5 TaxID=2999116 RepID=UPI0022F2C6E8|nr:endospore germination permease [Oceanirhabdus sp. W0125-5]WBW99189.1 endospore germination permease [Oceanirhabdus sp. W0125-5]
MKKETITDREGISIMILFIIGTNSIMAAGLSAEKDIWLAIIIAIIMALPIILVYARMQSLFKNKDFFDVIEMCFGKIIGKGIAVLIIIYVFWEVPLPLRNFTQFPVAVSLNNTPQLIVTLIFMIVCIWIVKEGVNVIGKWARLFLIPFIVVPLITPVLMFNSLNINNILPILNYGIKPVFKGAYEVLMFPFTQIIVFVIACSDSFKKNSHYNVYLKGLLLGGLGLLILSLVTVLVLGSDSAGRLYYPSYETWLRIKIVGFQRMEIVHGVMFVIGAFIKVSIFLMATCKGISKIFGLKDYRNIVTPVALIAIILAQFQFHSVMHYFEWNDEVWYYYAFPFQVILPIIIWIVVEIKKKRFLGIE